MLSGKKSKGLLILFSLFAVTMANASPTISRCHSNFIACVAASNLDTHTLPILKINQTIEPYNPHLVRIGEEFLKPPIAFMNFSPPSNSIKSLPGIPGTFLMVLIGFICVSLIKDRKFWLAASAGVLWLGQAGLTTLPQLVSYLASKKHIEQQFSLNTNYIYDDNSCRLRSDIEDTQYIGLLHYLAGIPDGQSAFANIYSVKSTTLSQHYQNLYTKVFNYFQKNTYTSQSAIILERYNLPLFKCLASTTKQTTSRPPAFIFAQLARGPPELV